MKRASIIAVLAGALVASPVFAGPVYWITLEGERNGSHFGAPRSLIEARYERTLDLSGEDRGGVAMRATVRALPMESARNTVALEMLLQRPTSKGDRRVEQAVMVVQLNELTAFQMDKDKNKMRVTVLVEPAPGQAPPPRSVKNRETERDAGIQTQPLYDHH